MSSKKDLTRKHILDAARRLLVERGYYGLGLEEVAREAGVSRQTIYLHFKSKAELMIAVAQYADEQAETPALLRPLMEAETAIEALDAGVAAYASIEPIIFDVASASYAARTSDKAIAAAWLDRMAFRRQNARSVIERIENEGLLADGWTVDEATDFTWALLSIHTYEYLVLDRGWPMERFVSHLQLVLRRAFLKGSDPVR